MNSNTNLDFLMFEFITIESLTISDIALKFMKQSFYVTVLRSSKGSKISGKNKERIKLTIFINCADITEIVQEEIFEPVMTILSYKTLDEIIERANATPL